jgi:hypothetical protein
VTRATAFWEASALVPLCVHEAASRSSHAYLRKFTPVVWWGSLVEVHSAICCLHREKEITDAGRKGALTRLRLLSHGWKEILPADPLRELALHLLGENFLRSADSLQLAASRPGASSVPPEEASSVETGNCLGPRNWPGFRSSKFPGEFPGLICFFQHLQAAKS